MRDHLYDMTAEPTGKLPRVHDYRDLVAWQRSMALAAECHRVARRLPMAEQRILGSQLRRAAISVPANIAEGNGRFTRLDYLRHLAIANGSLNEVETHLHLLAECEYLTRRDLQRALALAADAGRLLVALIRSLRRSDHR